MKDYLVKALAYDGKVRAYAINTTELANVLHKKHGTFPTTSAALGRAASIGAMMGAMLKGDEKLTIQVNGDGPIGQIVIDAGANGIVRGYVKHPEVDLELNELGKLDVAGAVGKGNIYVIKDLGLKDPYIGSVPITSGELGEDFTYYFVNSEQIPTAIGVGVLVNTDNTISSSGGFIIQALPGVNDEDLDKIEEAIAKIPSVSKLIEEGKTPEDILVTIFKDKLQILDKSEIEFGCNCSRERIENILISLGKEEIEDMIENEGESEIICQFCRTKYYYDENDLKLILDKIN